MATLGTSLLEGTAVSLPPGLTLTSLPRSSQPETPALLTRSQFICAFKHPQGILLFFLFLVFCSHAEGLLCPQPWHRRGVASTGCPLPEKLSGVFPFPLPAVTAGFAQDLWEALRRGKPRTCSSRRSCHDAHAWAAAPGTTAQSSRREMPSPVPWARSDATQSSCHRPVPRLWAQGDLGRALNLLAVFPSAPRLPAEPWDQG